MLNLKGEHNEAMTDQTSVMESGPPDEMIWRGCGQKLARSGSGRRFGDPGVFEFNERLGFQGHHGTVVAVDVVDLVTHPQYLDFPLRTQMQDLEE